VGRRFRGTGAGRTAFSPGGVRGSTILAKEDQRSQSRKGAKEEHSILGVFLCAFAPLRALVFLRHD